ncbi:MAG: thioesterase family protein [Polyangiaceae bacterium]
MGDPSWRDSYSSLSYDKLRYADTDRQGHVNNAVFSTFLETGRVELLYNPERPLAAPDAEFVIVSIKLVLEGEIHWPGQVDIGTRVARIGKTSVTLEQALFQNDRRVATAESVIVQIGHTTRKSLPLTPESIHRLESLKSPSP